MVMSKESVGTAKVSLMRAGSNVGGKAVTVVTNVIRFVNPLFWLSVVDMFIDGKFLNPRLLVQAFLSVLLPTIYLVTGSPAASAAFKIGLFSPWSIGCAIPALTQTALVSFVVMSWGLKRTPALPEAITELENRIADERAYRNRRYDVYLPPASKTSANSVKGIVLIPGALMDHRSYSEVAGRLADEGSLVLVLSLEPLRVAVRHGGADASDVLRSIEQTLKRTGLEVDEWTLAAHSQGTVRAIDLPGELKRKNSKLSISTLHKHNKLP